MQYTYAAAESQPTSCNMSCRNAALSGVNHDIHADIDGNQELQDMHADAEKFDPRTEQMFKILQVISACAMSFAHGEC
jgi:sodium-dependent phosphate transporter